MLSVLTITDAAHLRSLRAPWEQLHERSGTGDVTLHPSWMLSWWDVFGGDDGRELRTFAFYDGDRLVGLAPLLARPFRYRRAIPFRRLEMLGSGELEADETCGDYLGLLIEPEHEAEVASSFAEALATNAGGTWDELVIPAMDGESSLPKLLAAALEARDIRVTVDERNVAPYIALPKTFDAYLGLLKQNKRAQLRKSLRAFEAWAGGPPALVRVKAPEELAEGKRILMALHRERWGGDGVFGSEKFRAFHDRLMPDLLAKGALDLGWMVVRDQPVAAFYNFRCNGKLSFYQSGRKLDIPDAVRVGVTMHAYLIKSAIEDGIREYDFLAGASQYKMSLALATRPLVQLRAVRPSLRETARLASNRAVDELRGLREKARQRDLSGVPPRVRGVLEKLIGPEPADRSSSTGSSKTREPTEPSEPS
jgi:CelD/BcsL family acetyltransferase involved in cellulose biosynthesis